MITTPALPANLLDRFPGLAAVGRTTTRLHPRPGPVTATGSHVGGPLRWPADEPWPTCDAPHQVREEVPIPVELVERLRAAEARRTARHVLADGERELHDEIRRLVGDGFTGWGSEGGGRVLGHRYRPRPHPVPNPMTVLAQLRADDVPDLPRPGGADLLQVLWCPFEHEQDRLWGPTVRLHWRREAGLTRVRPGPPPSGEVGNEGYLPRSCRVFPEQVVEYPFPDELPAELRARVDDWEQESGADYVATFMAPGWKVGGYANWSLTDLIPTPCPECAGPTALALVVASSEYDGGTRDRWRPVERPRPDDEPPDRYAPGPTGVTVGRWGSLRIFVCPTCPGTPFLLDLQ
ncbi:hypothetical protein GCM10022225_40040 [Plantactinospora mayteni]|uniref:DUF1963 domain-containing protein n=1 Tax=Plantactinospora mayteni TaxID=566021 RepID=A0ABQ4ETP9_9ACTN|nr:hypothetical protein [Plantactinospora mayteni]GIG98028.1 hypothetical protein Pma05_46010 [Plantactinospora mayteni]